MSTNNSQALTLASKQAGEISPSTLQETQQDNIFTVTEPRQVVIDPDGELHLTVGILDIVTFVVCPKTLARSSPFWKTLLYGGFAESIQPDGASNKEWVVRLPEDDPEAMEIFLNIVHGYFDKIPTSLDSKSSTGTPDHRYLYNLTVLTNKYDLTRILLPWARNWVKEIAKKVPLDTKTPDPSVTSLVEHLSWIAWELGDKTMFVKTVRYLILHSVTRKKGGLRHDYPSSLKLFSYNLEPTGLSSFIEDQRLEAIREMLEPVEDVVASLLRSSETTPGTVCSYNSREFECEMAMLGVIVHSLTPKGLYPIPKHRKISVSVMQLGYILKAIDCKSRVHGCDVYRDIRDEVCEVEGEVGTTLTQSHVQHLKAQAKKSGLAE
ncbi:hypothetical protein F4776DRAFT_637792 [Hypoxylon sp. NC0597]|nr:hypothetical protein F4776DRAFT_637792 [Hypoxylon sp. NC0597]